MSSIITSLLKVTVGFLVDKARDRVAEILKDGDVVDKKIREIIAREIEDVKLKLDALSRKDLLAAIDAFETGLRYLYRAMELETDATLSQGKERFKMAREKATEAVNNESLSTLDRITAIRYRVMAAILESAVEILGAASESSSLPVKSALKGALPECEQCLRKLHSLPDVKNNFKVELNKGLLNIRGRFRKEDRREIIAAVWQVNRTIYDVMQPTGENIDICYYPTIDIEDEKIDPLRDERVAKVLLQHSIDHQGIVWSFGEDGEDDHKLKKPSGIAINTDGEFIIADNYETVKVFDNSGKFIYKFYPHEQTDDTIKCISAKLLAVATDENKNTYVLVLLGRYRSEVQVFNRADLRMKFQVRTEFYLTERTVGNGKVLVLADDMVHVYDLNGRHERTFRSGVISNAIDIAVGPGGQIFVLDSHLKRCMVFNEDGVKKDESTVHLRGEKWLRGLAFHPLGEYFFVVGVDWLEWFSTGTLAVEIYTTDGEFSREIILRETEPICHPLPSFAISKEGRLAVTCTIGGIGAMVIVI